MWYKNIAGRFFGLVTKHACDRRTDRRTDKQKYDSQDRASIAASRGKKPYLLTHVTVASYTSFSKTSKGVNFLANNPQVNGSSYQ